VVRDGVRSPSHELRRNVFLIGYGAVAGFNVGDEKPYVRLVDRNAVHKKFKKSDVFRSDDRRNGRKDATNSYQLHRYEQ
jgi:hypothetical protein